MQRSGLMPSTSRDRVMFAICNGISHSVLPDVERLTFQDWGLITKDAVYHGIAPVLYSHVRDWPPDIVPSVCVDTLRDSYLRTALNNSLAYAELRSILALFAEAGIPTIVLKGAYLAAVVYSSLAHRPMSDVDLLLPLEHISQAYGLLTRSGYVAEHTGRLEEHLSRNNCVKMFSGLRGLHIELHWTLAQGLDTDRHWVCGVWERAIPVRTERLDAKALSPVDLLLHLCIHTVYDHRCSIPARSVMDIACCLKRFWSVLDPTSLRQVSADANATRALRCGVLLAQRLFPSDLPEAFATQLGCSEQDEQNADLATALLMTPIRVADSHPARAWNGLTENFSWAGRIRILTQAVVPPAERIRRLHYPHVGVPGLIWFYLARPWRLLATHLRYFFRLVLLDPTPRSEWELIKARKLLAARVSAPANEYLGHEEDLM